MKINNIDISNYSAELINRQVATANIDSITNWIDEACEGVLLRQDYDFKTIALTFLVTEVSEDQAYKKISALTKALEKAEIKFDDINLLFPCALQGSTVPERVHNAQFKVTYTLKNDWAVGEPIALSYDITQVDAYKIQVNYIRNWSDSIGYYTQCFDEEEKTQLIAQEIYYIGKSQIPTVAQTADDWNSFFMSLGIDINKYKEANTLNGFAFNETEYSAEAAQAWFAANDSLTVYYNRYRKEGYADVPEDTKYPSVVWSTGADNTYYFDLKCGNGWDIKDLTIFVYGRWFQTATGGNGPMFGAGSPKSQLNMTLNAPNINIETGDTLRSYKVFESSKTSAHNIVIVTLENVAYLPFRKYGIDCDTIGTEGYAEIIFNGITLDRVPVGSLTLDSNLTLLYKSDVAAKYCEVCRVQVYYKKQLIRDLVPIAGNVKNCFYNNYDGGLYDINTMEFFPWSKIGGDTGAAPQKYMPLPPADPGPTPPPEKYQLIVNGGSGDGLYEAGALVFVDANEAPEGQVFKQWIINQGNPALTITEQKTSFTMPAERVEITAEYEEKPAEPPKILPYSNMPKLQGETVMGADADVWAQSTSASSPGLPRAGGEFVAVYSVPNVEGSWSIHRASYYTVQATGTDQWGRTYVHYRLKTNSSQYDQSITFTPSDGSPAITQTFAVRGLF